jgi:type I restriction enzyme S subunit
MPNALKKIEDETPFVTVKHLSSRKLLNIPIPIPPLPLQEKIVSELDLLSGVIEKKRQQLKELDNLAQSIFYDMFGDISDHVSLSVYIKSLAGGKSLAGADDNVNKVLKSGAVTYDYFKADEVKDLPLDYTPREEHLLNDGDLLISRMNTLEYVGACAYVWRAPKNTYLPDRLWRATLKDNVNPIYLWYSIVQPKTKDQIRDLASGTSGSMKNISIPRFLSVKVINAPLPLQQSFAAKVEAIEQQKALIKQSLAETETLFNSRMEYYFGEGE